MQTVTLNDFYKSVKEYIKLVIKGEEIILSDKDKQPVLHIEPIKFNKHKLRPFGLCSGKIKISNDFDNPLPDEIIKSFE